MSVTGWGGVTLTVEIDFVASGSWFTLDSATSGILGTNTLGPGDSWTDVTAYVQSLQTFHGRSHDLDAFQAGTATVVLKNRDGRFSSENSSGPYYGTIFPARPIRIKATYNSITYPVWFGRIDSWEDSYPGTGVDVVTTLSCTDMFRDPGAFDGTEQTSQGDGEMSGARINRILGNINWTSGRSIDGGVIACQATTLSQNALTELKLTADSDGGAFYAEADGTLVFADRNAKYTVPRMVASQATFGDSGSELHYSDIRATYDDELVANEINMARVGGTNQQVTDGTSIALYGGGAARSISRTDLICQSDAEAQALAYYILGIRKDAEYRFTQMQIKPQSSPSTLYPQVLGRLVLDRVTIKRRPLSAYTISKDCFIEGVSHVVTPDMWTTTFNVGSASAFGSPFVSGGASLVFVLDSAARGVLDTNVLPY